MFMIENLKITKENDTIHNDTIQKWPFLYYWRFISFFLFHIQLKSIMLNVSNMLFCKLCFIIYSENFYAIK